MSMKQGFVGYHYILDLLFILVMDGAKPETPSILIKLPPYWCLLKGLLCVFGSDLPSVFLLCFFFRGAFKREYLEKYEHLEFEIWTRCITRQSTHTKKFLGQIAVV